MDFNVNMLNYHWKSWLAFIEVVADPGFPLGGGANSEGVPTYDFAKFSQKLHEIERIWAPVWGAHVPRAPLDPPLRRYLWSFIVICHRVKTGQNCLGTH